CLPICLMLQLPKQKFRQEFCCCWWDLQCGKVVYIRIPILLSSLISLLLFSLLKMVLWVFRHEESSMTYIIPRDLITISKYATVFLVRNQRLYPKYFPSIGIL